MFDVISKDHSTHSEGPQGQQEGQEQRGPAPGDVPKRRSEGGPVCQKPQKKHLSYIPWYPRYLKKYPKASVPDAMKAMELTCSATSVRRRLYAEGLHGRKPAKKPLMAARHRKVRVEWAKSMRDYPFKRVLFTDEKKWVVCKASNKWVWRPVNTRYHPKYTSPTRQAGGGSVMVWGAISATRTYPLVRIPSTLTGAGYADLLTNFFSTIRPKSRATAKHFPWVFQQDNAPIHTSKVAMGVLKKHRLEVLKWPALSPDLSPIENLWSIVSQRLYKASFATADQMFSAVQREWDNIPPSILTSLYESMSRRCDECIKARGYPTRY